MAKYNVSGVAYDSTGNPAAQRKVFIYDRATGVKVRELTTDITGAWGTWFADPSPVMVVIQPAAFDNSNAKIYDNVVPTFDLNEIGINSIGQPGMMGFGVGICPNTPANMEALPGYNDPASDNYGNYRYTVDGSIMVWIPAFWFKMGTGSNGVVKNGISLKDASAYATDAAANADGYVWHRAFIDGGVRKTGFFIDKYRNSRNKALNCPSSIYGQREMTFTSSITAGTTFTGTHFADFGLDGSSVHSDLAFAAAALRGSSFNVLTVYQACAIWMLYMFQKQESVNDSNTCAWKKSAYPIYQCPRGISSSSNYDPNDRTNVNFLVMNEDATRTGQLAGAALSFNTTTHNGQNSGISGISGGLYNILTGVMVLQSGGSGNTGITTSGIYILKESVKASAYTISNYRTSTMMELYVTGSTFPNLPSSSGWSSRLSDTIQTFVPNTDRNSSDYKNLMLMLPNKAESITAANGITAGANTVSFHGGAIYFYSNYNYFWGWGGERETSTTGNNGIVKGPGCIVMDQSAQGSSVNGALRLALYI